VRPAPPTAASDSTAGALGARLRAARRARGLSLSEAARRTGISSSFLSLVERGQSDITFGRLLRLTEVYGVSVTELVPGAPRDTSVVRRDEQVPFYRPGEGMEMYLLTPDGGTLIGSLGVFEPGTQASQTSSHEGDEFVYVLEGSVELDVGAQTLTLQEGDTVLFDASRPHTLRNVGRTRARALFAAAVRER
jgi:transcriptional regulator with XRE-family HTH domain